MLIAARARGTEGGITEMDDREAAGAPGREEQDSALLSFSLLLSFLDRAVDAAQLRHDLGKGSDSVTAADLLWLARRLPGVKARKVRAPLAKLTQFPLPAIARLNSGEHLVLLQIADDRALIFRPNAERPEAIPLAAFGAEYGGETVLVTTRERLAGASRAFDVSWFIPSLIKYRHLLRDVLLASLFLQIMGLISPIFFQVVIDKVLVHKGITTLEVLAVGLFVISVFEVVMGGLRTYLFAHTTSRVDAELGSKLFSETV